MQLRTAPFAIAGVALLLCGAASHARTRPALPVPAHGVIGVEAAQLTPEFWVGRLDKPDQVLLDHAAIDAQNARLFKLDDSMHDLAAMPGTLSRPRVAGWIKAVSQRPQHPLYDASGDGTPGRISEKSLDIFVANLALDALPEHQSTRFGLIVRRANLRTFPTSLRVSSTPGEVDIDRFQETALFPGTPVVIAHESASGPWLFVVSPRYAGWVKTNDVAEGTRAEVLGYQARRPYRVITGARQRTVFTRERPQVSQRPLEMGVRLPLADLPPDQPVNGQHPYTSWTVELPVNGADGRLVFAPALLPRIADSAPGYLPLTRSNLIRQAFKFLGERYGWGHAYNARDCSGFVSEVYRSMGVVLPRNTGDQATSPALHRQVFGEGATALQRMAAVNALEVGDLVYVPGHVMMVIGHLHGTPYVIHDIHGGSYLGGDGELVPMHLNGVSVTPLAPLMLNIDDSYIERMTAIVSPQRALVEHSGKPDR